jgi:hypothetical protein
MALTALVIANGLAVSHTFTPVEQKFNQVTFADLSADSINGEATVVLGNQRASALTEIGKTTMRIRIPVVDHGFAEEADHKLLYSAEAEVKFFIPGSCKSGIIDDLIAYLQNALADTMITDTVKNRALPLA